jgi:hypothetical protein
MRFLITVIAVILISQGVYGQGCCSGGTGSPIAGGASQGVLQEQQIELAMNYQYFRTNRFLTGDDDTSALFDHFTGTYSYYRLAYGLTKNLTMSVESGYYFIKTQISLNGTDTIISSGIGDLILFPRYDLLNKSTETTRTEITVGLGLKIPIGKYNDSTVVFINPETQKKYYTSSPPTIQPTNGSNDFIFYGFIYRGYPQKNFRLFANLLYIKKGWNPLGQKFGDYCTVGIFAGTTVFNKIGLTLQLKGELLGRMKQDQNIDMLALYNIDINSTGGKKLIFVPQVSYSYKSLTFYALADIPLYQYVNRVQIATQYLFTAGLSYRVVPFKSRIEKMVE